MPRSDPQPHPEPRAPDPEPTLAASWSFPCLQSALSPSAAFVGGGAHRLGAQTATRLALEFSGQLCQPSEVERDVVFVVDVTGSMGPGPGSDFNHDPRSSGTCGRLEAIRRVLAMLPSRGTARAALLTFNTAVVQQSRGFFSAGDRLEADLAEQAGSGATVDEVVCAANGATDYGVPLKAAAELFERDGRKGAQREVYFISDGEPTDSDGSQEAAELKAHGATIAALILIGNDQVLRDRIASRDGSGQPLLRRVDEAGQLAEALAGLATSRLTGAELRLKAKAGAEWQRLNLLPSLSLTLGFSLSPIDLPIPLGSEAVEVELDSWDNRSRHQLQKGTLSRD